MAVTAAELQAVLGVDSSQATQELNSFDRGLRGIAARGGRLTGSLGKVNRGMKRIGGTARGLVTATIAMAGLDAGVGLLGDSIIGLNSTLEKSEIQFATLMGDADKAKKHVDSLFQFAKKTPFETEPIIQASKYLQQFGGEALNTTKNLTLVGDASAATGAEFSDLSMWVGRMYGNLQAGKPVGEAMARLQELGVITPKVRLKIEKMQKAGKKSGATLSASW